MLQHVLYHVSYSLETISCSKNQEFTSICFYVPSVFFIVYVHFGFMFFFFMVVISLACFIYVFFMVSLVCYDSESFRSRV